MTASVADRLAAGASASESGCLVWKRSLNSRGYGLISVTGKVLLAHRVAYELEVGPIPSDMTIDHLCRTKACINTAHMEVVTRAENGRRGSPNTGKTMCKAGHPLAGDNLIIKKRGPGRTPVRNCRTCANMLRLVAATKAAS